MKYYTYPQAPRLTKFLHLRTLDKKGVFVFYSHLLWRKFINRLAVAVKLTSLLTITLTLTLTLHPDENISMQ